MSSKPPAPITVNNSNNGGYTETLQFPVSTSAPITSPFGRRTAPKAGASTIHKGIDIGVPTGTPVSAAASGTVVFAGTQTGYGKVIIIKHDDDTETKYAHLSDIDVHVGQTVVGGELIAKSGATGNVTGPHLHYEVIKDGQQVNPLSGSVGVNANKRNTPVLAKSKSDQALANTTNTLNDNQDEIIKQLISGEHFKDNPANDFDNLTYHWRFFMTTDQEVIDGNTTISGSSIDTFLSKLNTYEQVTIAESGVTTYSIDEVTMDAVCGTDFQTESTFFTSIEMKITEPNGVNFLDSMRNAALQLGVRNYQKCFYYLELRFKGYDKDGNIDLTPFDKVIPNNGHWVWTVKINDIDVNLTAGGGSYNVKMVPFTDSLLTGTYNLIPATLSPSGATIGAFFDDLCTKLNNVWANIKADPGIVQYKMKFHPVPDLLTADQVKAMSVAPSDQDLNPIQGFDFNKGTNTAQIAQGFTISRTLDAVMTACEQAQKLAADELLQQSANSASFRQSILWRIEPEVHIPNYDPIYNEYYHHITLHVYGFRNHAAVLSPQDTLSNASAQKAILTDMAKRNFLPKKYEYLFTGLNSEVIDMDLNFNLKWQALLPSLASNTQEQAAQQSRVDPKAAPAITKPDAAAARTAAVNNSAQEIGVKQGETSQNVIQIEAAQALAEKEPPSAEKDQKLKDLAAQHAAAIADLRASQQATRTKRSELTSARPASLPQTNYGRTFGEDLTQNSASYNLTDVKKNEKFPISVQVYTPTTSDTVGLPGQFHEGKSIYGAVLNQVYGPVASQFFTVSVSIKGDPFWIGAGSFEQAVVRATDVFYDGHPNYTTGCNCFLFKMKYPLGQDENGNIILNNNETVTGIYQVNKITHKFVDGKFTQVLNAYRVPIIDLYTSLYNDLYPKKTDNPQPAAGSN